MCPLLSRVHISKSSLEHLGDAYEVEEGRGGQREQFLADNDIETFLIVRRKKKQVSAHPVSIETRSK